MSWRQRPIPKFSHVLEVGGSVSLTDRTGTVVIAPVQAWWSRSRIPKGASAPWARISRLSRRSYRWTAYPPYKLTPGTYSGMATTCCAAFEACFAAAGRNKKKNR
jgi:hypothetical protein